MSHFTVLVIGNNVDEQMARYHEFECTGEDDQYVIEVDTTAEAREEYEKDTNRRYKDPEGVLHYPYDEQYYRDPTPEETATKGPFGGLGIGNGLSWDSREWSDGKGYRSKIHFIPDGWEDLWVPTKDVKSFRDFIEDYYSRKVIVEGETPDLTGKDAEHKYGYTVVDKNGDVVKTIDRTNPRDGVFSWRDASGQEVARTIGMETKPEGHESLRPVQVAGARWDSYQIGGRWNGFFKLKNSGRGVLGKAGLQRMDPDYKAPAPGRADQAAKGDIDIEAMRQQARDEAAERYDKLVAVLGGDAPCWDSWETVTARFKTGDDPETCTAIEDSRQAYWAQPQVKAIRASDLHLWEFDDYLCTREEYANRAAIGALRTFALLKNGEWFERGRMGWCWGSEFERVLNETPDDVLLTVCDCHI